MKIGLNGHKESKLFERGLLMRSMEEVAAGRPPTGWLVGWKTLFVGCGLLLACNLFLWVWDYNYAFTAGLVFSSHTLPLPFPLPLFGEFICLRAFARPWDRRAV